MTDFLQQFEDDLSKAFTDVIEETGWTNLMDAKLGDGTGVVIVPPAEAKFPGALWVYKTVAAGRKERIQVANTYAGIPYNHDWAELDVKVGYPPGERHQLEIMQVSRRGLYMTQGALPSQVQAAITEHLSPERWEPLRLTAGAGLALNLIGGWLQAGSTLIYLPTAEGILDLTGHRPSTTHMARYCLVYYDPDGATFGAVDGTDFDDTDQTEAPSQMPTAVPSGALVLGHVRLYNGQTGWGGTDILRGTLPFLNPSGIVPLELGGGGIDLSGIQGLLFYNEGVAYPIHCAGDQVTAPTVNDDETSTPHAFGVLSLWVMSVEAGAAENAVYMCVDPSDGAAVWLRLDGSGGGGSMTSFGIQDDYATTNPITDGNTLRVEGVGGIEAVFVDTDHLQIQLAATGATPGSYTFASITMNAQGRITAIASGSIAANSISNTQLADMAALTVKVRASNSSGDPSDLAFTADGQFLVRRSSALTVGTIVSADLTTALTTPPAIGGTTPAAGTFTVMTATTEAVVRGAAGTPRALYFRTSTTNRWVVFCNAMAEGGSDSGSDFAVGYYADNGAWKGTPFTIARSSGDAAFSASVTIFGGLRVDGVLDHNGSTIGFNGVTPVARGTIYGAKGAGAEALHNLLQFLQSRGDIIDSTTWT